MTCPHCEAIMEGNSIDGYSCPDCGKSWDFEVVQLMHKKTKYAYHFTEKGENDD